MSKPKIIIAALILGLGLAGAYFIISYGSLDQTPKITAPENTGNNPVGIQPVSASSTQNITNLITQKIAESIADQNKDGFITSSDGKTLISAPKPEKMVSDLIAEAQKNFDPNSLRPQISDSFLNISEDNSKQALINYFSSFLNIINTASKQIPDSLNNSVEDIQISDFSKMVSIHTQAINSFYALSVPKIALNIHKKELELITTEKNIYEKLANADQDPMTAFLAANELLKIENEFAILKINITDLIKKQLLN